VARAAGRELVRDEEAVAHVRSILSQHGVELSRSHERQGFFPEGAETFPNIRGTALGFACPVGEATLVAMPGVPDEMKTMFTNYVLPRLLEEYQGKSMVRKVHLFGVPESEVDERLADMMEVERNPSVGLTVAGGVVSVCLRAQASDEDEGRKLLDRDEQVLRERFGDALFGTDTTTLAASVSDLLEEQELRIGVAESCTGGATGSLLVNVPGISRFFLLDVVAYSNEAKRNLLSVPAEEIESDGAVSPQVAESMARGVCEACGADIGISTTGIAGPTGGSREKPVGLVYFGVCVEGRTFAHRLQLRGNRQRIKDRAARHALNFARLALLERRSNG
jgi:nicotinamide-nucleotide amidase